MASFFFNLPRSGEKYSKPQTFFSFFPSYLLFEENVALHLNKHENAINMDALCQV